MSDKSKETYEKEPVYDPLNEKSTGDAPRRGNPSLFGPVVLIALGVLFLLNNLGMLPAMSLNWVAAARLWPLFLILVGANLIVRQAPRPLGGILSALVGVAAVGIFGYALLFSQDNPRFNSLGANANANQVQTKEISFGAEDVQTAVVEINIGAAGADLSALEDSNQLIEGTVSYMGDLTFDTSANGSKATIFLQEKDGGLWWLNPSNWNATVFQRWQIALNPRVSTDLRLDVGAGSVDADLSKLTLQELNVDGGAGSLELSLPDGTYDVTLDVSAGSTQVTLPRNGRQRMEINGGAGSLTLLLPAGREARVSVNGGLGSFNLNGRRFTQISGNEPDEGVWETEGYKTSANPLDLTIDVSAGSVTIREP